MSSVFTPTRAEQTGDFTQPLDGDDKDAASVLAFLRGLANDLAATQRCIGLEWSAKMISTLNLERGAWSPAEQAWYAVAPGGSDAAAVSYDGGRTWATIAPGVAGLALEDVAPATSGSSKGNLVFIASGSRTTYIGVMTSYGSFAWATTTNALTASPTAECVKLTFDETSHAWLVVYRSSSTLHVDYSTDGIAWTAASLPAAWASSTSASPQIHASTLGLTVAWAYDASTVYLIAFSADGGATWTESTTIPATTAATPTALSKPAHDAVRDEWYVAASATGPRSTQILRSSDGGVTWVDTACATPDMALQDLVAINGVLVGVNDDGRIFRSTDRGAHWALVTINAITTAHRPYLRQGDGQLAVWNAADKSIFVTPFLGAMGGG